MSIILRIALIAASAVMMGFMLKRIRHSKLQIEYSIFWILFSFMIFILSIFPQIGSAFSRALGFQAPINFVLLFVILLLIVKLFFVTIEISNLENRIKELVQNQAIDKLENKENEK